MIYLHLLLHDQDFLLHQVHHCYPTYNNCASEFELCYSNDNNDDDCNLQVLHVIRGLPVHRAHRKDRVVLEDQVIPLRPVHPRNKQKH